MSRLIIISVIVALLLACSAPEAHEDPTMTTPSPTPTPTDAHRPPESSHFPKVRGSNLEGRSFALPEGIEAELAVVMIAFKQRQQEAINTWLPLARELAELEGVAAYELPVLGLGWLPMRGWIDGGMASGIADPVARATTITIYTGKRAFRGALELPSEDRIYTLVIDREGHVLWRAEGTHNAEAEASLRALLDAR